MILILVLILAPIAPIEDATGDYNAISELMWCIDRDSCIHEVMHYMDDEMGWPSHSDEFADAVQIYLLVEIQTGDIENVIRILGHQGLLGGGGRSEEFYAELFNFYFTHRGEVPEAFADFYDWNIVDALKIDYENGGSYWLGGS